MRKLLFGILAALSILILLSSCERVAPNYVGVMMTDYGKNGKSDFKMTKGRVNTSAPGTELFQVPLFEQRAGVDSVLHLKTADNTEITASPSYSYTVIEDSAVNVVFQNKHLGSGDDFMKALEDNILEMKIRDIIKEESRRISTDTLMANSGSLAFEKKIEILIANAFKTKGLKLESLSSQIDFTDKVKDKIDNRNEVQTNITVLNQQIEEQKKRNELAQLKAEENIILSRGLTQQILQQQFIDAWRETKQPLYGASPLTLFKTIP